MRNGSLKIATIFGVDIFVHFSFLFILGLVILGAGSQGPQVIEVELVWLVALFASVIFHEMAHTLVARRYGIRSLGIMIMALGGVSMLSSVGDTPPKEFKIAVVGPFSSAVLGTALLLVSAALGYSIWPPSLNTFGAFLPTIAWTNFALAAFNLIPAYPLDGGRIFKSFLQLVGLKKIANYAVLAIAYLSAAGIFLYGLHSGNFIMMAIAVYIAVSAPAQLRASQPSARIATFAPGVPAVSFVYQVMLHDNRAFDANTKVKDMIPWIFATNRCFPVYHQGRYLGVVGRPELINADPEMTAGQIANFNVPVINFYMPLSHAYQVMAASLRDSLPVELNGRIVGVLLAPAYHPISPPPPF
jgi:Zn-dependent protease